MQLYFKLNIEKIKKTVSILAASFVFIISFVILLNVYRSTSGHRISTEQKFLKHLISDHNVNSVNFKFIKLEPVPLEYFDISGTAQTVSIPFALFILSSIIIIYFPKQEKISYAEIFLFTAGFKSSLFRPPKY
ncbi:MAG: hypothetical protein ABIY50_05830 [Ignavibacteria bacterium]